MPPTPPPSPTGGQLGSSAAYRAKARSRRALGAAPKNEASRGAAARTATPLPAAIDLGRGQSRSAAVDWVPVRGLMLLLGDQKKKGHQSTHSYSSQFPRGLLYGEEVEGAVGWAFALFL